MEDNNNEKKVIITQTKTVVVPQKSNPQVIESTSLADHLKENANEYVPVNYKKKAFIIGGIIIGSILGLYLIITLYKKIDEAYDAKYNTTTTNALKDVFIKTTTTTLPHYEDVTEEVTTLPTYIDVIEER